MFSHTCNIRVCVAVDALFVRGVSHGGTKGERALPDALREFYILIVLYSSVALATAVLFSRATSPVGTASPEALKKKLELTVKKELLDLLDLQVDTVRSIRDGDRDGDP